MNGATVPVDAAALVQAHQVHCSIYTSPAVFEMERQRLWARAWLFVGHDSQVPQPGDFITTELNGQSLLMLKREDGAIALLHNRCAHKGAPLATAPSGHAGRFLRCAYHGWSYRLDGSLLGLPLKTGYDAERFASSPAQAGITPYGEVAVHRGFVFARQRSGGPTFADSMGELLQALDLLCDRSPVGRLQVAGGVLRTVFHANWKLYLENVNDAFHPVTTHASVTQSAQAIWGKAAANEPPPLALKQLLPFAAGYSFFEQMGARVLPHGHSVLGTQASLHSSYSGDDGSGLYAQALSAAHGAARAQLVLSFAPQNVVFYPSMALKGAPQVLRVLRPQAADRTLLEAWAFQPEGAPADLLHSALLYNRQVFSPLSMLAHDDLHLFETMQRSLAGDGNPWISLHRGAVGEQDAPAPRDVGGTDEAVLRNQYRAWADAMAVP